MVGDACSPTFRGARKRPPGGPLTIATNTRPGFTSTPPYQKVGDGLNLESRLGRDYACTFVFERVHDLVRTMILNAGPVGHCLTIKGQSLSDVSNSFAVLTLCVRHAVIGHCIFSIGQGNQCRKSSLATTTASGWGQGLAQLERSYPHARCRGGLEAC